MNKINLENFRCFYNNTSLEIRPITIFIGENSTGKSSLLSAIRLAWDVSNLAQKLDFNEAPFTLGSFDTIASYKGGSYGRAKYFKLGWCVDTPDYLLDRTDDLDNVIAVNATFTQSFATPELSLWALTSGEYGLTIYNPYDRDRVEILVSSPSGEIKFGISESFPIPEFYSQFFILARIILGGDDLGKESTATGTIPSEKDRDIIYDLGQVFYQLTGSRPFAFSPIRTKPLRIYEPFQDFPTPEGSHVPILLADIKSSDPDSWKTYKSTLEIYGAESGLFKSIQVRRQGRKVSDPFQIQVKISGPSSNLIDVGYGVSQALPILVESIRQPAGSIILLQQPEVHLHPRAQSELASFLSVFAIEHKKHFVIETHSDFFIDRIRMSVRDDELISNKDVAIYFLHRKKGVVNIDLLELDEMGNYISVPRNYRDFFLNEERRLLGG